MILSYRHDFVFIKGVKVAGTSIETALASICGPEDIVTPITPVDEAERLKMGTRPRNYARDAGVERAYLKGIETADATSLATLRRPQTPFFNHMALSEVAILEPRVTGMRVIVCERDPYAKVISLANMVARATDYKRGLAMKADFSELRSVAGELVNSGKMRRVLNIDLYRNADGAVDVELLRYEHLHADFAELATRLDAADLELPHLKRGLMSNELKPTDVFEPAQIDAINDLFAVEFETFGYARI